MLVTREEHLSSFNFAFNGLLNSCPAGMKVHRTKRHKQLILYWGAMGAHPFNANHKEQYYPVPDLRFAEEPVNEAETQEVISLQQIDLFFLLFQPVS